MSYQVIARKWRPKVFAEMVGQEHVLRAIINALDNDRLHHAFLFTGTRGVGKTTIARILAKSLNCEAGVSSKPCGQCSACTEIDEGRFIDLIEVDAASRTKVEDTRELLDNVQYAPTRGRYKVYLIDEVHMLSTHSFNALLKTLEEPPPHVKFLLATTDPQRLPVTILSRCLQFNLKRLPLNLITGHLSTVLTAEKIVFDQPSLSLLAHSADGSMRDALSLLDQAIAYGGGKLEVADVREMLGTIDQHYVMTLLRHLSDKNGEALLQEVDTLAQQSPDFGAVLAAMISVLHQIALVQAVPKALGDEVPDRDEIVALAAKMSAEDAQLFYQIALLGRRDLGLAPEPRSGFEMVLLRMLAFQPASATAAASTPSAAGARSAAASAAPGAGTSIAAPPSAKPVASAPVAPAAPVSNEWGEVVAALNLRGAVRSLAVNSSLVERTDTTITLLLDSGHAHLRNDKFELRFEAALQQYFAQKIKLVMTVGAPQAETPASQEVRVAGERKQTALEAIEADPNVQSLKEAFGAKVIPGSVNPVEQ
ncbi:MAG: DNA polymerase III subunit gamma/tau [Thiotrichales bacterium]|nr:MAG: DNA polymerase III subunit gamma/tau [Thiotrichales bacterium]PCI12342.1 MAG: DNA polymerase III subunit gamma/tau [Thiotrichales bacterium]